MRPNSNLHRLPDGAHLRQVEQTNQHHPLKNEIYIYIYMYICIHIHIYIHMYIHKLQDMCTQLPPHGGQQALNRSILGSVDTTGLKPLKPRTQTVHVLIWFTQHFDLKELTISRLCAPCVDPRSDCQVQIGAALRR